VLNNTQTVRSVTNVSLNSVSGTLVRTASGSKFAKFCIDSPRADYFLNLEAPSRPFTTDFGTTKRIPVEVLQVMLCGDGWLIVEFLDLQEV
jgi:hypothetical protein